MAEIMVWASPFNGRNGRMFAVVIPISDRSWGVGLDRPGNSKPWMVPNWSGTFGEAVSKARWLARRLAVPEVA